MDRNSLKLGDGTDEETREAIRRYQEGHELDTQEEAIRHALPNWAFQHDIPPELAATVHNSEEYFLDLSVLSENGRMHPFCHTTKTERSKITQDIKKVRLHVQRFREAVNESDSEVTVMAVYDIDTLSGFIDNGFHPAGARPLSELDEHYNEVDHISDIEITASDAYSSFLDIVGRLDGRRVLACIPQADDLTAFGEETTPALIYPHRAEETDKWS
jgi:hypothetical protein